MHEATLITADDAILAWSGPLRTMDARREGVGKGEDTPTAASPDANATALRDC